MSRTPHQRDPETQAVQSRMDREVDRHRPRTPYLTEPDMEALRTIGTFRVVHARDLDQQSIEGLMRKDLVVKDSAVQSNGERIEAVRLTKAGIEALEAIRPAGDQQRYWNAPVKLRELPHDLEIYRAFQREKEAIERAGGTVQRVVLDNEFKAITTPVLSKKDGDPVLKRWELADKLDLPIQGSTIVLPDLRIEYTDAAGREQHQNIEIVTPDYTRAMVASKQAAGFKIHRLTVKGTRAGGAVKDNHHFEIFD
jgi:hypothetical protein